MRITYISYYFLQASQTPPKSLDELLKRANNIDINDIQNSIDNNLWTKKFHNYLEKRRNAEDIATLKFLLKMEVFNKNELHLKQNKNDTKAKKSRRELFSKIVKSHFDIENDVLALSNSTVSDYLCSWTSESSDTVTEEDVKYLLNARNDPTVWAEGLEPTYQKFLSEVSASKLACILSIL